MTGLVWIGLGTALAVALFWLASRGPWSLRARFVDEVRRRRTSEDAPLLGEEALAGLPLPVAAYIRRSGAVDKPLPVSFRVQTKGRIRQGPDDAWMSFESTQVNFIEKPARLFFMKARKGGLPVEALHLFIDGQASMQVRLLSMVPLINARGPEMSRAETVTLLNDLCLFAPGALISKRITWQALDDLHAVVRYRVGSNTVSAKLTFNEQGELVDFESNDRLQLGSHGALVSQPWSTPIESYQTLDGNHVVKKGKALWHAEQGSFAYIELQVTNYGIGSG